MKPSNHLQKLAQEFSCLLLQDLEDNAHPSEGAYYDKKDLEKTQFFQSPSLRQFFRDVDIVTLDYDGADLRYHYSQEKVRETLSSPYFWFCCFVGKVELANNLNGEQVRGLFDTKKLPLGSFQKLLSDMKGSGEYTEDIQKQFLKANNWQKDVLVSQAKHQKRWMYDWDMPERLKRQIIQKAISKKGVWGDVYLLGYGGGELFNHMRRENHSLAKKVVKHHGFNHFRDKYYFHNIIKSEHLHFKKTDQKQLFKQALFCLKGYRKQTTHKSKFSLPYIKTHAPEVFRLALFQFVKGCCRRKHVELLGIISNTFCDEKEGDISFIFSKVLNKPLVTTLLEIKALHPNWHNVLEKSLIQENLSENSKILKNSIKKM